MKLIFICLIAIVAINAHLTTEEAFGSFQSWTSLHNKVYTSTKEYMNRFKIYTDNLNFIEEHNRSNKGFTVAMNKFGDLTREEFGAMYNNFGTGANPFQSCPTSHVNSGVAAPDSVDWRTKGAVTGVKNQGQCGSCWAFSTTGSMEGAWFLAKGKLVSLSEQNLVDCSGSQGNYGCNGGLMDLAFQYIYNGNGVGTSGIDTESSYPYTAQDGSCSWSQSNVGATLSNAVYCIDVNTEDESALQDAVVKQPVSVAIDASQSSFQFYSSGVYNEPDCSSSQLDHGVLAVGYGVDNGTPYWLVKNSWGTDWGMQGYIEMSRNANNQCGIATAASYPVIA
jgi:cathepsin L